jgi:hypothetical protein
MLKERIKEWAAAHDCLDDYENKDFKFLFKVGSPSPVLFSFILFAN